MEPLLNMEQAAALLSLTKKQLYELTRRRARLRQALPVPLVKLGKRRMFRASSLHAWVTALEQQEKGSK